MSRVFIVLLIAPMIAAEYKVDPSIAAIGDISTVSKFADDTLTLINGDVHLENLINSDTDATFNATAEKLGEISAQLKEMEANDEQRMDNILATIMNRLSESDRDMIGMSALHNYTFCVDCMYEKYLSLLKDPESSRNDDISNFVKVILSDGTDDLPEILSDDCTPCTKNLHRFSAEDRTQIQELLNKKNNDMSFGELCGTSSSRQQRLFEVYRTVLISEAREYVMKIFSYAISAVKQDVSLAAEMQTSASELVARSRDYLIRTKTAMADSSLAVDLCDPNVFDRGINYLELEGAIQTFIANEINLSSDSGTEICSKSCSDYKNSAGLVTAPKRRNRNNWYPAKSCNGRILDCVSGGSTKVCEMDDDSTERYSWIIDGDNNTYGNPGSCAGRLKYPEPFNMHDQSCEICICTCIEETGESPAIRTINLRPALSDIDANRVVTGIRFISSDNLIQIQIEEGELLSGGCITEHSERWVDTESFQYTENGISDTSSDGAFYLVKDEDENEDEEEDGGKGEKILLERDIDFAFITDQQRTINLDELVAPSGHVITGVKFQYKKGLGDEGGKPPLQLAVRVTKFNFTSGILCTDEESSSWISNNNEQGSEIDLTGADRPTKLHGHVQISEPGQYIRFTATCRHKDAGQSTIPFFDAQAVTTSISIPLNGLGLLHRGTPGSGGFLAFRLLTLDLSQYINAESAR